MIIIHHPPPARQPAASRTAESRPTAAPARPHPHNSTPFHKKSTAAAPRRAAPRRKMRLDALFYYMASPVSRPTLKKYFTENLQLSEILKYFCSLTNNIKIMKIDPKNENGDPWWVIVVKVLVYAAGLFLAGYGTTSAAMTISML